MTVHDDICGCRGEGHHHQAGQRRQQRHQADGSGGQQTQNGNQAEEQDQHGGARRPTPRQPPSFDHRRPQHLERPRRDQQRQKADLVQGQALVAQHGGQSAPGQAADHALRDIGGPQAGQDRGLPGLPCTTCHQKRRLRLAVQVRPSSR